AAIAVIVSSPWFIYNKREFGSFMPSSGVATSARGEFRGIEEPVGVRAARALECFWWSAPFSGFGSVTLYSGSFRNAAGWAALAAVVPLIFALRHHRRREDVLLFAAVFLTYAAVYTRQSVATWFFNRYMFPSTVLITMCFAYLVQPLIRRPDYGSLSSDAARYAHLPKQLRNVAPVAILLLYLALNSLFVVCRILA